MTTRDRLLTEGMRLFGERGYAATSVAQIEAAAGLSPGSGALYKHFPSKQALLTAGLDRLLSTDAGLPPVDAGGPDGLADHVLAERLLAFARAGLRRMDADRDLSRLLLTGLQAFPELLTRFGDEEIARAHRHTTELLAALAPADSTDTDWAAIAVVLQGATANYWVLTDIFGVHPTGIDEDRFVRGLAAVATAALRPTPPPTKKPGKPRAPRRKSKE